MRQLDSPIYRARRFALLRACRLCAGLRLARRALSELYRLRRGRRLPSVVLGRARLLAPRLLLLRRGRVRDRTRAKPRSRGLPDVRAFPKAPPRDAESWARASA